MTKAVVFYYDPVAFYREMFYHNKIKFDAQALRFKMENQTLVSIITVVFNAENTIKQTIESVFSQSYKNIEYIVIDGGSTDGTVGIVNKYKDKIAKFISKKDKGIYDGMNKGLELASGGIVGILNSDDFYASNDVIETIVKEIKSNEADACWADLVYVDAGNTDKIVRYWRSSEYKEGKFKWGWMPPHPAFFVKKRVYEEYGGFNLKFRTAADYELMLRFLEKHKIKSCHIRKTIVKMRTGGRSNNSVKNIIRSNIDCYRAWKENGLNVSPLIVFFKPLSKTFQYFTR